MREFDRIRLTEDIPFEKLKETVRLSDEIPLSGFKKGTEGVILEVFLSPSRGYLVELFDDQGESMDEFFLEPHQIEPRLE